MNKHYSTDNVVMIVLVILVMGGLLFWPDLLLVIVVFVLWLAGVVFAVSSWRNHLAIRRFREKWFPQGKDLLLVVSNSPNWAAYTQEYWLPRWGDRAVFLNWSERSLWVEDAPPEIALFRRFAGSREFNPMAIVVPARGHRVRVVRFWRAFRDFKHGRPEALRIAEDELDTALNDNGTSSRG